VGKISVNFNQLGVHRLSLSSHKIYGPKGCGALIFDPNFPPHAHLPGGGQEFGYRSGTENVAAIVGLGKAAELAQSELFDRQQHLLTLRLYLEQQLQQIPRLHIFAANSERLPNTVQFGVSGINGEMLLMLFDQRQIAVSSGSACAASHNQPSPVLIAMGIATELANSAIRISLGQHNTRIEIDQFIHILKQLLIINRNF
jgi:cysteine desulfurase